MSNPTPKSHYECCHAEIIQLTAQDNVDDLVNSLIKILKNCLEEVPFRFYLYTPKWTLSGANPGPTSDVDQTYNDDLQYLEKPNALATGAPSRNEKNPKMVFPVRHGDNRDVIGSLLVDGKIDKPQINLLTTYLQIFANNYFILHAGKYDALTGLLNRKAFDDKCDALFNPNNKSNRRTDSETQNVCLAVIDIDRFKSVNDRFGHLYGDEVLIALAQLMQESFRDEDLLFRYGGEEFVVILKQVDDDDTFAVLDRFRQRIEDFNFPLVGQITVSIGFTSETQRLPVTTIFGHADQALYHAKNNGRNQVINFRNLDEKQAPSGKTSTGDIELFE